MPYLYSTASCFGTCWYNTTHTLYAESIILSYCIKLGRVTTGKIAADANDHHGHRSSLSHGRKHFGQESSITAAADFRQSAISADVAGTRLAHVENPVISSPHVASMDDGDQAGFENYEPISTYLITRTTMLLTRMFPTNCYGMLLTNVS